MNPTIVKVRVTGSTRWESHESASVRRFRGYQTKEVAIKGADGKLAMRATRFLKIVVLCSDGIWYTFDHQLCGARLCDASRSLVVHGARHSISFYDKAPAFVEHAYAKAIRRVKVCMRIMAHELHALPAYRSLPKKAA